MLPYRVSKWRQWVDPGLSVGGRTSESTSYAVTMGDKYVCMYILNLTNSTGDAKQTRCSFSCAKNKDERVLNSTLGQQILTTFVSLSYFSPKTAVFEKKLSSRISNTDLLQTELCIGAPEAGGMHLWLSVSGWAVSGCCGIFSS